MLPRVWLRSAGMTRGLFGSVASELALSTWMLLSWMNRATKQSTMKMPEPADPPLHQGAPVVVVVAGDRGRRSRWWSCVDGWSGCWVCCS